MEVKQTITKEGSTSSSLWTWKQVITEKWNDDYIETNKSIVYVDTYLGRGNSASYFGGSANLNITCDGQQKPTSKTFNYPTNVNAYSWVLIQSESFEVEHNSNGKKTIAVSSSMSTSNFTPNSASASCNVELTTIPRASDIAVSNTDLGQNIPITIGKKSDSFTSTLTYTIGSLSGTIATKTSLSNYPWVMSSTLIEQIKNAYPNSGSYSKGGISTKVTCQTFSGNTLIGTKEATFKLYITDKPSISSAVRTELNTNITALTTKVLRHISQNKFTITANAPTGASIIGYRVKNGTRDSGISANNIVNLGDIQDYYEENNNFKTKFIVTCVDSRGNESEEYPVICDFINYIQVSINKTDVTIKRSTGTSNDCKIYLTGNFYNGKIGTTDNVITFKVRYKLKTSTEWSTWTTLSAIYVDNTFKVDNVPIIGTFDYKENYDFELMAIDKIGDYDDVEKIFATSVAIVKYHKNGADFVGLSINKYPVLYFTEEEEWEE